MRWPFHFGKARTESKAGTEPAAPPQRLDWASVAPMQRMIGDPHLTAPSLEFGRSLAGSEEPALSLEPLGHHRSIEGPRGLVAGIAQPIESYAATTELVGRARRRSEATVGLPAVSDDLIDPISDDPDTAGRDQDSAPAPMTPSLRALVETQSARSPANPLTDASRVELGPLRPVQRSSEIVSWGSPGEGEIAPEHQPAAASPSGARLNLGLSRRHGLGAPVSGASPAMQQSTAAASFRATAPLPEARSLLADAPTAEPGGSAQEAVVGLSHARNETLVQAPPDDPTLSPLPPVRGQGGAVRREEPDTSSEADAGPPALPAAGGAEAEERSGARITPSSAVGPLSIQRLVGSDSPRPAVRESLMSPVPDRTTLTVPLTSARPTLATIRPSMQPSRGGMPGLEDPRALRGPVDRPQPAPQAHTAPTWSQPGATRAAAAPHFLRVPEHSPLVWGVQRLASGAAPGDEQAGQAPAAAESPSAGIPGMGGAPAAAPSAGFAPTSGGAAPEGAPHPGEAAQASEAAPGAGTAPAPHGEKEIHELAQAIFDPFMALLRRHVLTEREQAGFVTDLR